MGTMAILAFPGSDSLEIGRDLTMTTGET